jgi:hypothetical protein
MVTVIHNLYRRNPYIRETVALNLHALNNSGVAFQYICFNDHGDPEIKSDLEEFGKEIEYVYADRNYGHGICSGGWVGAIPFVLGSYIHNTGQDDVFTPSFYRQLVGALDSDPSMSVAYANCIVTDPNLNPQNVMLPCQPQPIYYDAPFEAFKAWFGVDSIGNGPTRANNHFPAPGVIYRRSLHDEIGIPDVNNFLGAVDFEYWSRILFHGKKAKYFPLPLWLYRVSQHSTSKAVTDADARIAQWNQKILAKYQQLWKERK